MQDISRDEFNLLSGGGGVGTNVPGIGSGGVSICDNLGSHHNTSLSKSPTIKLEDVDNYSANASWNSSNLCNLL